MARRWTKWQVASLFVVLAPFGLSLMAHALPTTLEAAVATERPALRFAEYLLPLGEVIEGEKVRGIFRFENGSQAVLKILEVKPSCGCLTPDLPKTEYAPGERGVLIVYPDTASAAMGPGEQVKEYYIDVAYEAGRGRETERIHIKFLLPERRVTVEPRGLLIMQGNSESTEREITVTDARSEPVTVSDVVCDDPRIAIDWKPAAESTDARRATIQVRIPPAMAANYLAKVEIHFDRPGEGPVIVPIAVRSLGGGQEMDTPAIYRRPSSGQPTTP